MNSEIATRVIAGALLSMLALAGCGGSSAAERSTAAPARSATAPHEEPAGPVAEPVAESPPPEACVADGPIDALAVGDHLTCWLREGRATCLGDITLEPSRQRSEVDLSADLLVSVGAEWCVATRGQPLVRCFGMLSGSLQQEEEERIERACGDDYECVDSRTEAVESRLARSGREFRAGGPIAQLASQDDTLCALTSTGRLRCWDPFDSPLGRPFRDLVVRNATSVALEYGVTCVVVAGEVECWDEARERTVERHRIQGLTGATRVHIFDGLMCAFDAEERAWCWGREPFGLPNFVEDGESSEWVAGRLPELDHSRALVMTGQPATPSLCRLDAAGDVFCWGPAPAGQLGTSSPVAFADASPVARGVVRLAAGPAHVCASDAAGALQCWGRADRGALGEERARTDFGVVEVPDVRARSLDSRRHETCARTESGTWRCWGRPRFDSDSPTPWQVREQPVRTFTLGAQECVQEVALVRCAGAAGDVVHPGVATSGSGMNCLLHEGRVSCVWASERGFEELAGAPRVDHIATRFGEVAVAGEGRVVVYRGLSGTPRVELELPFGAVRALSVGSSSVCMADATGAVRCARLFGGGRTEAIVAPPTVQLASSAGAHCGLSETGVVYCWGLDRRGHLGSIPASGVDLVTVPIPGRVAELSAGVDHVCARTTDERVFCWGSDEEGQLGRRPAWWVEGPVCVSTRDPEAAQATD